MKRASTADEKRDIGAIDNSDSAWLYALSKDTPARLWWNTEPCHPAVNRALGIGKDQPAATFALEPFRPVKVDGQWRILAAWPTPRTIGAEPDEDWLGISHVLSWCPKTNTTEIVGDAQAQLVGTFDSYHGTIDTGTLFGQARPFFQAWAAQRAQFATFYQAQAGKDWTSRPIEPDLVPGCLLIGEAKSVRWNLAELPKHLECVGLDPKPINAAIMRSVRLPRVTSSMRAAA